MVATAHVDGGYQWRTPGAYVDFHGATIAAFRNSMGRPSLMAGYTVGDTLAITVGAVAGYGKPMAFASASVAISLGRGRRLRLNALPRPKGGSAAINIALERTF
jgi:hypothetical protein